MAALTEQLLSKPLMSAPVEPCGISFAAMAQRFTSGSVLIFLVSFHMMSYRSFSVGQSKKSKLSKRPGRNKAGSIVSGLDDVAMTYTPRNSSNPSISVNNWLTNRSMTPALSEPLRGHIESNSSKNKQHGAAARARLNTSRMAFSDSPINLDMISGPRTFMHRMPDSVIAACATNVFPTPGGP